VKRGGREASVRCLSPVSQGQLMSIGHHTAPSAKSGDPNFVVRRYFYEDVRRYPDIGMVPSARILSGLPPYGPLPTAFPPEWGHLGREGNSK
jgi:hypothetical protein